MSESTARRLNVLLPGFRLHWYEIHTVLGQGGFGVTYSGWDTNLVQPVAIKEFFPRNYASRRPSGRVVAIPGQGGTLYQWALKRFLDEAQTLARFRHPNIVQVFSAFEANGTAYVVMALEKGMSLSDAVRFGKVENEAALLGVVHALLDGLERVHQSGFIHRDIKPSNILLREDGSPVLIDFGSAAKAMGDDTRDLHSLVSHGYTAFEQYEGGSAQRQRQGPWTDIYSLGATLYRVLIGQPPPDALQRGSALLEGIADPLRPVPEAAAGRASPAFLWAIERALAFRPGDRPASVAEWRALLPEPSPVVEPLADVVSEVHELRPDSPGWLESEPTGDDRTTEVNTGAVEEITSLSGSARAVAPGLRALVVDDDPASRNLTRRVLERIGVEHVELVDEASEALTRLESTTDRPEVLLLDLQLKGMDGVEFLRHLAGLDTRVGLVLLGEGDDRLLSSVASLARFHGLNVLGTLSKPVVAGAIGAALATFDRGLGRRLGESAEALSNEQILEGLDAGRVVVVYQPKVSVVGREVIGVEALARWVHPRLGLLGAGAFTGQAARLGRVDALTHTVFEQAMAAGGEWQAHGLSLNVAVNLYLDSLQRLDLPDYIVSVAQAQGLATSQVTLELSEGSLVEDLKGPLEVLTRLRMRGVCLSIDDFGTGSSTLARLRQFPFTELKLDGSFVSSSASDPAAQAILESSVQLGRRLGLGIVAEGVETDQEETLVRSLGCDSMQGYHIARPMRADEVPEWVERWRRSSTREPATGA